MKVNWSYDFGEDDLRKVRAEVGRSGSATRKEMRGWISKVVYATLTTMNPAKPKRRQAGDKAPVIKPIKKATGWKCPTCKQWRDEPMGRSCQSCRALTTSKGDTV